MVQILSIEWDNSSCPGTTIISAAESFTGTYTTKKQTLPKPQPNLTTMVPEMTKNTTRLSHQTGHHTDHSFPLWKLKSSIVILLVFSLLKCI